MKKDINPFNEKREPHGYWEAYYSKDKIIYKGNYINGNKVGYWVNYDYYPTIINKTYYIL